MKHAYAALTEEMKELLADAMALAMQHGVGLEVLAFQCWDKRQAQRLRNQIAPH